MLAAPPLDSSTDFKKSADALYAETPIQTESLKKRRMPRRPVCVWGLGPKTHADGKGSPWAALPPGASAAPLRARGGELAAAAGAAGGFSGPRVCAEVIGARGSCSSSGLASVWMYLLVSARKASSYTTQSTQAVGKTETAITSRETGVRPSEASGLRISQPKP